MALLGKERKLAEKATATLLESAQRGGAQSSEVCTSYSHRTRIVLEKQDYHLASADEGYSFGIRVLIGEQQGFASTNNTEPAQLRAIASAAIANAKLSPPNPYVCIPTSGTLPVECPTNLVDPDLHNLSIATQKEWLQGMIVEATRDKRFRINEGTSEISGGLSIIANSTGVHRSSLETEATWSLMGMAVEGEKITSFDYYSALSRKAHGTAQQIRTTTKEFCERVLKGLKSGPANSYRGVVFFSPRAVSDLLLSPVSFHLNARSVVEKTGRWSLADVGKSVFHPSINITDDPWLVDRFGWSPFDREGTPTKSICLIEKGTIANFLFDSYAAKALKRSSTGNAAGGPSSLPAVSPHCLNMGPGETSLVALTSKYSKIQKEFLWADRFSGQVNPVTGDFSGVAKAAQWWTGGEFSHTVSETLISGNLFEVFGKALLDLSKETWIVNCSEALPVVVSEAVSVTSSH